VKILFIRLRLIGDVVFTTPLLRAVKEGLPGARLSYLVEQEAAAVVAGNPFIDELIMVQKTRGWRRIRDDIRLARALRGRRFDVAVDLHGGPRSAWLTAATGAPQRIGYDLAFRPLVYTRRVHRARDLRPRHSVLNQWDLLSAIDGWTLAPDPVRFPVEMPADADVAARVDRRLAEAGVADHDTIVVVHVSAGNPFRRWPEASFVALVTALAAAGPERRLVLSSGPSDREAAERIAAAARTALGADRAHRIVRCGELDLRELRAVIGRSRLFVGGDTGPMHVAATTATPIVALYGPTPPARSQPWRDPSIPAVALEVEGLPCRPCDQRVCAPGDFRCLSGIPASAAIEASERLLARAPA
jgi:predicted lipopolysaccharide heptosyltransferase III